MQAEEKITEERGASLSVQHWYAYDLLFYFLLHRSTNHRPNRWFSVKLISLSRRSIEWIENIFLIFILICIAEQRIDNILWQEFYIYILLLINHCSSLSIFYYRKGKRKILSFRFTKSKDCLGSFDYLKRLSSREVIQRNCSSLQRLSRLPCKLAG